MKRGFTLVELLVVLAVIAMLVSYVLVLLADSRAYARDANRVSNMEQLQRGLSIYTTSSRTYPVCNPKQAINGSTDCLSSILPSAGAMSAMPIDPLKGTSLPCGGASTNFTYCYFSDGYTYTLEYHLETDRIKPAGWHSISP